jgi:hypothetical protein
MTKNKFMTLAEKVFNKLNERNPCLLNEIIEEIESEDKSISIDQYMYMNPEIDPHEWDYLEDFNQTLDRPIEL